MNSRENTLTSLPFVVLLALHQVYKRIPSHVTTKEVTKQKQDRTFQQWSIQVPYTNVWSSEKLRGHSG